MAKATYPRAWRAGALQTGGAKKDYGPDAPISARRLFRPPSEDRRGDGHDSGWGPVRVCGCADG
eukprot:10417125-Prorocentrum_lima.AAC.1